MVNNFVTEISESDFRKLNLVGYDHKMVDHGGYNALEFVPKSLNDVIDENKNYCKENNWSTIAIALHIEPTEEEIQAEANSKCSIIVHAEDKYKTARDLVLNKYSYYDKWLNRLGASTYLVGCGIEHLYSTRDYWEIKHDYWKAKKKETKAIYIVHLEF